MAEQELDGAEIGSSFEQVHRKCVPQGMRCYRFGEFRHPMCLAAGRIQGACRYRFSNNGAGKHPYPCGSHGAPIVRQHLQQPGRQHDIAVFLSLALFDAQHHALAVDTLRLQPGRLGNTQAGGIACCQDRLVFEALDASKEVQHLLGAENDGQCLWCLWARNDLVEIPIEAERDAVEESKRRDGHVHRTWRQLLLVRQIDLVGADILRTEAGDLAKCRANCETCSKYASCVCRDRLRTCMSSIMRVRSVVIANSLTRGTLRVGSNTILPRASASEMRWSTSPCECAGAETRASFKGYTPALNAAPPAERVRPTSIMRS